MRDTGLRLCPQYKHLDLELKRQSVWLGLVRINCFCHPLNKHVPVYSCCVRLLPAKDGKRTLLRDVFKLRTDKYLQQSCRNSPGAHKQVFAFAASA